VYYFNQSKIISALRAFPSGKAYSSCTDLPLYNFIKIVLTGELRWLVIWGWPSGLAEKWERIFEEDVTLNPDKEQSRKIKARRNLQVLQTKLYLLRLWIKVIQYSKNPRQIQDAKESVLRNGYHEVDNIERLISHVKLLETNIKDLEQELEHDLKQEKSKKHEELTESDFDNSLVSLAKGLGFDIIDSKKITVSMYRALQKRLNDEIENGAKRNNK